MEEKILNREIVAVRIQNKHFYARFKTFQIMAQPIETARSDLNCERAELICVIINFETI